MPDTNTLQQSLIAGRWALLNTLIQRAIAFISFLVLARLVTPEDFGIIALIAIVPTFIDGITAFAFDTAAIQKGQMEKYLNAIWTFNILRASVIFAAVFATAPYIADFYHIPDAIFAVRFAALGILIQNFANIGQNFFFRDLDFKSIFIRDLVFKGGYAVAAVALSFYHPSYLSLFAAGIISSVAVVFATYALHPYRPRFDFNFGLFRELRSFSQWFYGQAMVRQVSITVQDSVIGRFTSPSALGLFSKAQALSDAPIAPLMNLINKVSFTSYVRVQDSPAHIVEGVYKTIDVIASVAIPYMFAILIAGTAIIHFVLGDAWLGMAPLLSLLVIEATIDIFAVFAPSVFNAIGLAHTQFLNSGVRAVTLAVLMIILVPMFGILGAAYAALISASITAAFVCYHLMTKLSVRISRILETLGVVVLACLVPLPLAAYSLSLAFFNTLPGFLLLFAFGGIAYFAVIAIAGRWLHKGPYKTIELLIHSLLRSMNITYFDRLFVFHDPIEGL